MDFSVAIKMSRSVSAKPDYIRIVNFKPKDITSYHIFDDDHLNSIDYRKCNMYYMTLELLRKKYDTKQETFFNNHYIIVKDDNPESFVFKLPGHCH